MNKKIIIHSNSPHVGSGYGTQTELLARGLMLKGWDVKISAFYGVQGAPIHAGEMEILPGSYTPYGDDALVPHWMAFQPDVFLMLIDIWVYSHDSLKRVPVSSWCPVDSDPIAPMITDKLNSCRHIMAMSRFGERQMRQRGFDPFYVPHMVDTDEFKPMNRVKARQELKLDEGKFVVACVAANKGYPPRKNLDRLLKAWALFIQHEPNSILVLHTQPREVHGGMNIFQALNHYEIPADTVRLPDEHLLMTGRYGTRYLNALYNAADIKILPSGGEGFGIPVMEAQAAGCPVIVTDFSAQSELAGPGYKIPLDAIDDVLINDKGGDYALPKVSEIVTAFDWAYTERQNPKLRIESVAFAQAYSAENVMTKHMLPALEMMAEINQDYKTPTAKTKRVASATCPNGHEWAATGVYNDKGELCVPCRRPKCEAELLITRQGQRINPNGFPSAIHGLPLDIEDDPQGGVAKVVMREIEKGYRLDEIDFQPGDIVIDIGAQVGIVSTYLGKKYPDIRILAYEPVPQNYQRLIRNLAANDVHNVTAFRMAVTGDGRMLKLSGNLQGNSGGVSAFTNPSDQTFEAPSITLDQILDKLPHVKLLKIDCEGAEYEILEGNLGLLAKVDTLAGEFHTNTRLASMGHDPNVLLNAVSQHMGMGKVRVNACQIAE